MTDTNKPVNLRAHHIDGLLQYCQTPYIEITTGTGYGSKHSEHIINLFNEILSGKRPVRIAEGFDDICGACPCKEERINGCRPSNKEFQPFTATDFLDRLTEKGYGVKRGEIYTPEEFFKKIGLASIVKQCINEGKIRVETKEERNAKLNSPANQTLQSYIQEAAEKAESDKAVGERK